MSQEPQSDLGTEQLRQRNRELTILHSIAEALNHEVDLTRALDTVLNQVIALFDLTTGWVWLFHDKTGESYLAALRNLPPGLAEDPQLMEGDCYCLRTYRQGDLEGAANVNVVRCSRLSGLMSGTAGLGHHASIPLYSSSQTHLGVLNVASKEFRRYLRVERGAHRIDAKKVAAEARYDGKFVLRTNAPLPAAEIALQYKRLLLVEQFFRGGSNRSFRPDPSSTSGTPPSGATSFAPSWP